MSDANKSDKELKALKDEIAALKRKLAEAETSAANNASTTSGSSPAAKRSKTNTDGGNDNGGSDSSSSEEEEVAAPQKRKRVKRYAFSDETDKRIAEGIRHYGKKWRLVAKYVGSDLNADQVKLRWIQFLDPSILAKKRMVRRVMVQEKRSAFNDNDDQRLREAVELHGTDAWDEVCDMLGGRGKTAEKCMNRWKKVVSPQAVAKRSGTATAAAAAAVVKPPSVALYFNKDMDEKLIAAVEDLGSASLAAISWNWEAIAARVGCNANKTQCKNRWERYLKPDAEAKSRVAFEWSPERDIKLAMAVGMYGRDWPRVAQHVGDGVQKFQCLKRWDKHVDPVAVLTANAMGKRPKSPWNDDKDRRLASAVAMHGREWVKVADFVGSGLTDLQCRQRWDNHVDPIVMESRNRPWSPDEDLRLAELVEQYKDKGLKGFINWSAISKALGRAYLSCKERWSYFQKKDMKKGSFTADEDETIIRVVAEFGGKRGKWKTVASALNRPIARIIERWDIISKRLAIRGQSLNAAAVAAGGGGGGGDQQQQADLLLLHNHHQQQLHQQQLLQQQEDSDDDDDVDDDDDDDAAEEDKVQQHALSLSLLSGIHHQAPQELLAQHQLLQQLHQQSGGHQQI